MDEIMSRASQYFREFEGRHLYPKLLSWYWLLWLSTSAIFAWRAYLGLSPSHRSSHEYSFALMFGAEFAFLCASGLIGAYKVRRVLAGGKVKRGKGKEYVDSRKTRSLERICGVDSTKFAGLAKECVDLIAAKKQFRSISDASFADILRNVYDPDSKARILALLLSAAAIFVALLNHSVPAEDFNILDTFSHNKFTSEFKQAMSTSIVGFGVYIGVRVLAGWILELLSSGWAVIFGGTSGSRMALNYFVRDLIRLHTPAHAPAVTDPTVAAPAGDLPQRPAPAIDPDLDAVEVVDTEELVA